MGHVPDLLLAALWIFGALACWPLYRLRWPAHHRRLRSLARVFRFHVLSLALGVGYVAWATYGGYRDAFMSPWLLNVVGGTAWLATAAVLAFVSAKDRDKHEPRQRR